MNAKKLNFVLTGLIVLAALLLIGGAYGANMLLEKQSDNLAAAQLESLAADEKQLLLAKARADIEKYQPLADIAKHIVPQDKDQAQTVREIVNIAAANGVKLGAVSFPSSSLGGVSASDSPALSQLQPVKNIPGVYMLEITVRSDSSAPAPYPNFIRFLAALEHNRRTALVNSIVLQPDALNPGSLTFSLNLSEYLKP